MKKIAFTLLVSLLTLVSYAQTPKISIVSCSPEVIETDKDIEIKITLKNDGDAAENNTSVILSSDNQYVTIIEDSAVLNPMAAGATQECSFVIKVNQMIPDNAKIHFNIDATLEGSSVVSDVTYDFEDGIGDWTMIDADGDGFNWIESGPKLGPGCGHESSFCMFSQSYDNTYDILYPDNYLVSPEKFKIGKDATFNLWACAHDKYYPYEHFGVAVSTAGNTSDADFVTIEEWTLDSVAPAKDQGEWARFSVDLSDYEGQELWIAVRHFDCFDQYFLALDDVEVNNVYQPFRWTQRFAVAVANPTPNIVFKSYQCDEITSGATINLNVTLTNEGSAATTYETKAILSSDDDYVTIIKGENVVEPLGLNQSVTKTFTFSTDANMPEDHEISFNINIEPVKLTDGNVDFTYKFEKDFNNWTVINANNDDHTWYHNSNGEEEHDIITIPSHSGHGHLMSESSCNATLMPVQPDDYIVTPNKIGIKENTTFSFWACAQDRHFASEHFGVAISAKSNTSADDFITIAAWDLTAAALRAGEWINYSVDLSEYAGMYLWIAIRHFNTNDMFVLCIDDVNISNFVRTHNWNYSFSIEPEVSLKEIHDDFNIFPNPVKNQLIIETNETLTEINIYDINGRLIYKENENVSTTIDMSDYNKGTYFLRMKTDEGEIVRKVVKN